MIQVDELAYQKLLQTVQQQQNYIIRLKDKYDVIFDQNYLKNKMIEELQQQIDFFKQQLNTRYPEDNQQRAIKQTQEQEKNVQNKPKTMQTQKQEYEGIKIQIQELYEQICELKQEKEQSQKTMQQQQKEISQFQQQLNEQYQTQVKQIKQKCSKAINHYNNQYTKIQNNYNLFLRKFGVLLSLLQQQQFYIEKQKQQMSKNDQNMQNYREIIKKWLQISEFLNNHLQSIHNSIYKYQDYSSMLFNFNLVLEQQIKELKLQLDRYSQQLISNQDTFLTQKQIIRYFYNYYQNTSQLFDRYKDHIEHLNKQAKINQSMHESWMIKYENLINNIQDQNDKTLMEQWDLLQKYIGQKHEINQRDDTISKLKREIKKQQDATQFKEQQFISNLQQQLLDKEQLVQQQTNENQMQESIIDEMQEKIDQLVEYQRRTMATISNLEIQNNNYQIQLAQLQQQYNQQIQELCDTHFNERLQKQNPEEIDEGEEPEFKELLFEQHPSAILYDQNQSNQNQQPDDQSNIPVINVLNKTLDSQQGTAQESSKDSRYESLLNKLENIKKKTYNREQEDNDADANISNIISNKSLSFINAQREENIQQMRQMHKYQNTSDLANDGNDISLQLNNSQIINAKPQINVSLSFEQFQSRDEQDQSQMLNQNPDQHFSFLTQSANNSVELVNVDKTQQQNPVTIRDNAPAKPKPFKQQDESKVVQPFQGLDAQISPKNLPQGFQSNAFRKQRLEDAQKQSHTAISQQLANPFSDASSIQGASQLEESSGRPRLNVESFVSDAALNESRWNSCD